MKSAEGKLKREISKRWPVIGHDMEARAQLEYILQEAGLLSKPRKRRKTKTVYDDPLEEHPMNPINQL